MSNYRGITLLDVVGKLFHKVLANRLLRHAEAIGLLPTAKNAFRRGRSCDEHIYCISQVAQGRHRMRLPTYAFLLDLRKAYDTGWRDGLLRRLWDMGIRGRMWRYVDALYARSVRVVRVERQVSQPVGVDLGVAQGDTLSCVLFSLYASDLITTYEAACAGVALPGPPLRAPPGPPGTQQPSPAARASMISAVMFADDFVGLAGSPAELQAGVAAARDWCDKWRMQANVGPGKTAVMLFAPAAAPAPLLDGDLVWGAEPLPVVCTYRYL
jgi:hypothetical protein